MDSEQATDSDAQEPQIAISPISAAESVSQIREALNSFTVRCDAELLQLQDRYLKRRPRLSLFTIGLALVVLTITTLTSCVMMSTGAKTGHMLLSSIGELFLFGLVIASGLTDILWRDPAKLLQAKDDQLAKIAGIHSEIVKLAELRQEWEKDVNWHRQKGGDARTQLAETELELANAAADLDQLNQQIRDRKIEAESIDEKIAAAEIDYIEAEARTSEIESLNEQANAKHQQTVQDCEALKVQLESMNQDVEQRKEMLESILQRTQDVEDGLERFATTIQDRESALVEVTLHLEEKQSSLQHLESALQAQQNRLTDLESQFDGLNGDIEELQQRKETLQNELTELDHQRIQSAQEVSSCLADAEMKRTELAEARNALARVFQKIRHANVKMDAQLVRLHSMEKEVAGISAIEGKTRQTAEYHHDKLNGLADFEDKLSLGLRRLENNLIRVDRHWEQAGTVLQGLEYDISDRQQISDALNLQLHLMERELLTACNNRSHLAVESQKAEANLEALNYTITERHADLNQLTTCINRSAELKTQLAAEYSELASAVQTLMQDVKSTLEAQRREYQEHDTAIRALRHEESSARSNVANVSESLRLKTVEFQKCEQNLSLHIGKLEKLQQQITFADTEREQKASMLLQLRQEVRSLSEEVVSALTWQRSSVDQIEAEISDRNSTLAEKNRDVEQLGNQLSQLEQQYTQAQARLESTERVIEEKSSVVEQLQISLTDAKANLESAIAEITRTQAEHAQLQSRNHILHGQLDDLQSEFAIVIGAQHDQIGDMEDQVSDSAMRLSLKLQEIEDAEEVLRQLERQQLNLQDKVQAVEGTIQLQQTTLTELADSIASKNFALDDLSNQIGQLQLSRVVLEKSIEEQQAIHMELQSSVDNASTAFAIQSKAYDVEIHNLLAQVDARQKEIDDLNGQFVRVNHQLQTAKTELSETEILLSHKQRELSDLESQITNSTNQLSTLNLDHARLQALHQQEIASLECRLDQVAEELNEAQAKVKTLDAEYLEKQCLADSLTKDVMAAEQALQILQHNHSAKLQEFAVLTTESQSLEEQIIEHKTELADISDDVERQQELLDQHQAESDRLRSEHEELLASLVAKKMDLDAVLEDLASTIDTKKQELFVLEGSSCELQKRAENQEMKINLSGQQLALLAEEIEARQLELASLEIIERDRRQAADEADSRLQAIASACDLKEQQLELLCQQATSYESKVVQLESQLDSSQDRYDAMKVELSSLNSELEMRQSQMTSLERDIQQNTGRLEDLRREVLDADQLSQQWRTYIEELQEEKSTVEGTRQQLDAELAHVRTELDLKNQDLVALQGHWTTEQEDRQKTLAELQRAIQLKENALKALNERKCDLENENKQLQDVIEQRRQDASLLSERLDAMRSQEGELKETIENRRTIVYQQQENEVVSGEQAEEALGRVEGLVMELEQHPEPHRDESESADRSGSTARSAAKADPWDDVLL